MKQQDEPEALDGLDCHGSAVNGIVSLLQELIGESTKSGTWSWHCGFHSLLGVLREFTSFYGSSQKPRRYL